MKVIVTGFNPFGTFPSNPSQDAVLGLPSFVKFNEGSNEARVAKLILPTCCVNAFSALSQEVASNAAEEEFAIILSGLADSREKINLERFALNVREFPIPDNSGHAWNEEYIDPNGPDALRSKFNLKELNKQLNDAGFSTEISSHAGTFVCNETYYRSLLAWQGNQFCRGILFVHFPPYRSYKSATVEDRDLDKTAEIYTAALQEIVQHLLRATPSKLC